LDPEAGYIIYSEKRKNQDGQMIVYIKKAVWGYRSMIARLVDPRFHVAWNVYTDFLPANADEGAHFPTHFQAAYANLSQPSVGDVLYDSACGEQRCLDAVYDVGGIPLFDIQRDPSDRDEQLHGHRNWGHCPLRGHGPPCPRPANGDPAGPREPAFHPGLDVPKTATPPPATLC